jgi:CelD/BcsL family acetyltransferase involved in cellulose biosynthesis
MRKNLRKRMQKLQGQYKVEFKTQRDFGSTREAMEIFFKLHNRRWESKGISGAFTSDYFRNFHLDVARTFDEKDWLALYFLTVNDDPIAAIYSFDYNLKKYGYLTGFAPDFGQYGVGNILKLYVIEECIRRGFKEYDLTRGLEPYKLDWATGVRKNFTVSMANKGWREQVLSWIYKLARQVY